MFVYELSGCGFESCCSQLISNLSDYNDAYILVKADIAVTGHNVTQVTLKNCAPFIKCITKMNFDAINFDAGIANDDAFKSFKYKTKFLGNIVADGANRILIDTTIAVPLKHLSNFRRSL